LPEIGGVFCEVDVTSDEKVAAAFDKARAVRPGGSRSITGVANAVGGRRDKRPAKALPDESVRLP
jgi:hypothetical protein